MRNLKKVLALVLALVMAMSLVTIATAADFSDDADINYDEAVDVMVAAGIIDGVGNNSFDPKGTLTREQAAKLITYMLMGENSDKLGVETSRFKDVAVTRWSAPAIEYCATMGIIDGAGDGNFYPAGKLTGYAFAKMLLTALGYSSSREGYTGNNWSINVATKALSEDVRLDAGMEKMFGSDYITREEAAQMALNAIKAPLVEYDANNTISVNGAQVQINGGSAKFVTTTIAKEQRISDRKLTNTGNNTTNSGFTVEFGEKYLPKLRRDAHQVDDFGRPSYTWSYDRVDIGTYVDTELLVAEYTKGVKGGDVFKDIGSVAADFPVEYWVDGIKQTNADAATEAAKLAKNNDVNMYGSARGALTQVFADSEANNGDGELTFTVINTYLAFATDDYSEINEYLPIDVFAYNNANGLRTPLDRENGDYATRLKLEDFPGITGYEDGDALLVNIADGEVKIISEPTFMGESKVTKFSQSTGKNESGRVSSLTTGGTKYDDSAALQWNGALDIYDDDLLVGNTYDIYLDAYGYVIGVDIHEAALNYVFISGLEVKNEKLTNASAQANGIFADDGSMKVIDIDVKATNERIDKKTDEYLASVAQDAAFATRYGLTKYTPAAGDSDATIAAGERAWAAANKNTVLTASPVDGFVNVSADANVDTVDALIRLDQFTYDNTSGSYNYGEAWNAWYSYTVKDNKYVLTPVLNQGWQRNDGATPANDTEVNSARSILKNGQWNNNATNKFTAYGDVDSVYITVDTDFYSGNAGLKVVDDVTSRTVGIKNVDLLVPAVASAGASTQNTRGVYFIWDSKEYVEAALVVGEDNGLTASYAYILDEGKAKSEGYDDKDTTWEFEAIVDGVHRDGDKNPYLLERNDWSDIYNGMNGSFPNRQNIMTGGFMRVFYNANGDVVRARRVNPWDALRATTKDTYAEEDPAYIRKGDTKIIETAKMAWGDTTLSVRGRQNDTLFITNPTLNAGGNGLVVADDCKFVVAYNEYDPATRTYEDLVVDTSVRSLKGALSLADYEKDTGDVYEFDGIVAAELNDRGEAKVLILHCNVLRVDDNNTVNDGRFAVRAVDATYDPRSGDVTVRITGSGVVPRGYTVTVDLMRSSTSGRFDGVAVARSVVFNAGSRMPNTAYFRNGSWTYTADRDYFARVAVDNGRTIEYYYSDGFGL